MAEPRDEQWYVDTKRRIREAFQLFDKDRKGCVVQEEVATIMRYLGSYPTERAMVKEILPDMLGEEDHQVKYELFEPKMLEMLAEGTWEPDSEDALLNAFKAFDPEGKGYIEASKLREALITKGTPFREKEIAAFLEVAKDEESGHVFYEDYVALLSAGA
jgi:Ca2+-binding EF-hand superfamily protein